MFFLTKRDTISLKKLYELHDFIQLNNWQRIVLNYGGGVVGSHFDDFGLFLHTRD